MNPKQIMLQSLEALAMGDAFGQRAFAGEVILDSMLPWTDDTAMAISIVRTLDTHGRIDQDELAQNFQLAYHNDPGRGYGSGMHRLMAELGRGRRWKLATYELFNGMGSFGNGGAMRAAPLGAYFSDDPQLAASEAILATEVTHGHPEGIAGGVAVAVAAALAVKAELSAEGRMSFLSACIEMTPESDVKKLASKALKMDFGHSVATAVSELGNGSRITAMDTVPLCLWTAAKYLGNFETAMHELSAIGGDRDTNCAIVGGIIGARDDCVIPPEWLEFREDLPAI
ncbi:MAG: ADP-ribosylglycohydrolase family protein [Planctomycetota bacterium]|jgi:ADP-ribosylglycohydrolase